MITAPYTITLDPGGPREKTLVTAGDRTLDGVRVDFSSAISSSAPLGARWGANDPAGATGRKTSWATVADDASASSSRSGAVVASDPAAIADGVTARISDGNFVFDLPNAVAIASAISFPVSGKFRRISTFSISSGRGRLVSGGPQNAAVPMDWLWTAFENSNWALDGKNHITVLADGHGNIIANGLVIANGHVEIVEDGGAKYMEFVFALPPGWDGYADAGYVDSAASPTMIVFIEHSIDLVTWAQGVFFDSAAAWDTDVFGWSIVRARCQYVEDVTVKSGDLFWKFGINWISGDFATLTDGFFDGAEMALSYPYDLNLNARRAALQTDLRALGYSGATVALASSVVTITLPSVTLSAGFGAGAHFFTDPRPYYDLWGNIEYTNQQNATLTNASSPGYTFRGDVHQFCRLRAYSLASDPPQLI